MIGRMENEYFFKIVMIGDSGVGKSCLLTRYAEDEFNESYTATIGVDFRSKILTVDNNFVKLQIWDTAGQERFKAITTTYYRNSDAIILVFDKNSHDSFRHINDWMKEINDHGFENVVKMMIGNKVDLGNDVSKEEAEDKARSFGIEYVETSAKNSYQVDLAFINIARQLIKESKEFGSSPKMPKLVLASEETKDSYDNCC
ncbi:hypothetical protein SteCoe_16188 [Stentor coeruleus]|uniref:Uncharacterized protein n=1 Tax=Stentor coeruleus TaxID=5963 RepID=A0A1R2C1W7_9CILI|nr:hypothetical protein SteCoe_16188 [Stentor coeruleus]